MAGYEWLADFSVASCLTVAVGADVATTASAFGVDLADPVPTESERWSTERLAAVVALVDAATGSDPVSVVVEDNGFEGSRALVLRASSKGGKAASVFWNVNGMVVFSCARRGKLLWSGQLGVGEDLEGLPRSLVPLAVLAEADHDRDPVAVGAAMTASFAGVEIRGEAIAEVEWCTISPHVEQPEPLTAESSGLRWDHDDLLEALVAVAPEARRALVHEITHVAVRQASLADHEVVAPVLTSVRVDAPGAVSAAFESWERRWERDSHQLWLRQDEATNAGGVEPLPEEERRVYHRGHVVSALRYACHHDDLTALLGVSDAAVAIFTLDGHEHLAVTVLTSAATAATAREPGQLLTLADLPSPPSPEDRDAALDQQRRERDRSQQEAELAEEVDEWGGRPPTDRMRASGWAHGLARHDRDLLDRLELLPDDQLTAVADWAARRLLSSAGLWDLPWVQEAIRGEASLDLLFRHLFIDPAVEHTDFINDDSQRCSRQAMALPSAVAYSLPDPFDAACAALKPAGDGPRDEAAAIYQEVRQRFGLG